MDFDDHCNICGFLKTIISEGIHKKKTYIYFGFFIRCLLRRLKAQTPSDTIPPIGKIPPFSKFGCNFWTNDAILMLCKIWIFPKFVNIVYFMTGSTISNRLGVVAHKDISTKNELHQCL